MNNKIEEVVNYKNVCMVSISHWGIFLIYYRYKGLTYMRYGAVQYKII